MPMSVVLNNCLYGDNMNRVFYYKMKIVKELLKLEKSLDFFTLLLIMLITNGVLTP